MSPTVYQIMLCPERAHRYLALVPPARPDQPALCARLSELGPGDWQSVPFTPGTDGRAYLHLPDAPAAVALTPARTDDRPHPALGPEVRPLTLKLRAIRGAQPLLPTVGGVRQILRQAAGHTWDLLLAYPIDRAWTPPRVAAPPAIFVR